MMFSDIWPGSYYGGKANYFIIIDNILSLFIIDCHGLIYGFKSSRPDHNIIFAGSV